MRLQRALALACFVFALIAPAAPASADITAFLGAAGGPSTRLAKGLALGAGAGVIGWEFEYSNTGEDVGQGSPRLQTGMVNLLAQTPFGLKGIQFYGTIGAGIYHEDIFGTSQTNVGFNWGLGLKKDLVGPLRIRVDYRMTGLAGSPIGSRVVHRLYVGANIRF